MLIVPLHWRRTLAANCFVAFRMFMPQTYHQQHATAQHSAQKRFEAADISSHYRAKNDRI